jgi:lactobin A/cerein 7B family class IIb bacteriocin
METKLNDNRPLDRELDTDELENVSGGIIPGLTNLVPDMIGQAVSRAIDGNS